MRLLSGFSFFVVALVIALLAYLPLRVVTQAIGLQSNGIQFDRAVGTIWRGSLSDVHVGGEAIGQVNLNLNAISLLQLKPAASFEFVGAAGNGKGLIVTGLNRELEIKDAFARIQLNTFKHLDAQLRRSPSTLNLSISNLKIGAAGNCIEAAGGLKTDLLTVVGRSWAWDGPAMDGRIVCVGDDYELTLQNQTGLDEISAKAVLRSDNTYDVEASVKTQNPRLSNALISYGFKGQAAPDEFYYSLSSVESQTP